MLEMEHVSVSLETRMEEIQSLLAVLSQRVLWGDCVLITSASLSSTLKRKKAYTGLVLNLFITGQLLSEALTSYNNHAEFVVACEDALNSLEPMSKEMRAWQAANAGDEWPRSTHAISSSLVRSAVTSTATLSTATGTVRAGGLGLTSSSTLKFPPHEDVSIEAANCSLAVTLKLQGADGGGFLRPTIVLRTPPRNLCVTTTFIAVLSTVSQVYSLLASCDSDASLRSKKSSSVRAVDARVARGVVGPIAAVVHDAAQVVVGQFIAEAECPSS